MVGPNLTDNLWIHGCSPADLVKNVTTGFPPLGMLPYGSGAKLSDEQLLQVVSYILSKQGTQPAQPACGQPGSREGLQLTSCAPTPRRRTDSTRITKLPRRTGQRPQGRPAQVGLCPPAVRALLHGADARQLRPAGAPVPGAVRQAARPADPAAERPRAEVHRLRPRLLAAGLLPARAVRADRIRDHRAA